ncbi:MAG: hypothetical protein R6U89_03720 [Dehalococcoidia bacterium]
MALAAALTGFRTQQKSLTIQSLYPVEDVASRIRPDFIIYKYLDIIYLYCLFIFLWLIQSQAQFGPPSANSIKDDSQEFTRILGEENLQFLLCFVGDLDHALHPFSFSV